MKEQVLILQEFFAHLAQFETELPTIHCYDLGSLIKSESTKYLTDKNTLEL